jgi:allantoate deiminase
VLIAVDVAARIKQSGRTLPFALEVVGFGDEEGTRFGATLLGSRALAGTWDPAWWRLTDADGVSLREAFAAFGLDPDAITRAARRPENLVGYLEAHIEQGPVLEQRGRALGLVTSIAGARRMRITVTGRAAHAGTPYAARRDALAGASEAILAVESLAPGLGLIATVGRIGAQPGAVNVVAGAATFSLDVRAASDDVRDAGLDKLLAEFEGIAARRGLSLSVEHTHAAETVHCDPAMKAALAEAWQRPATTIRASCSPRRATTRWPSPRSPASACSSSAAPGESATTPRNPCSKTTWRSRSTRCTRRC